jgi:hypothetical protein
MARIVSLSKPLLIALAAAGAASCSTTQELEPVSAWGIVVSDQANGQVVTITTVDAVEAGFIVIHETAATGLPIAPESIGSTAVGAGRNEDVAVTLTKAVAPGDTLIAMIHHDTGEIGVYEFGPGATEEDKPVVVNGGAVISPFVMN